MSNRTQQTGPDVRFFPLAQIKTRDNARKEFNAEELRGLAASMRESREKMGSTLQPLLGYMEGEEVILIAGERRLRAAPLAGYEVLPVQILPGPCTEADYLLFNLTENLQREDLQPMETAARIKQMLGLSVNGVRAWSKTSLAEELGKDEGFVARCLAALEAIDSVQEAVKSGLISMRVAAVLGSLPRELQEEAAKVMVFGPVPMSLHQAEQYAAENLRRDLRRAKFSLDDGQLVAGVPACRACPHWGGNHPAITGKFKDSVCLNPACFERKSLAFLSLVSDHAEEQGAVVYREPSKLFEQYNNQLKPQSGYSELEHEVERHHLVTGAPAGLTWEKAVEGCGVSVEFAQDYEGGTRRIAKTEVLLEAATRGPYADSFKAAKATRREPVESLINEEERALQEQIAKARKEAGEKALLVVCGEFVHCLVHAANHKALKLAVLHGLLEKLDKVDKQWLAAVYRPDTTGEVMTERLVQIVADGAPDEADYQAFSVWMDAALILAQHVRLLRFKGMSVLKEELRVIAEAAQATPEKWQRDITRAMEAAEEKLKPKPKPEPGKKAKPAPIAPEIREQARVMYEQGMTRLEIGKALGVNPDTVGNWQYRGGWKRAGEDQSSTAAGEE